MNPPSPKRQLLSNFKTAFYRHPKDEIARMIRWGPRAYFFCDRWMKEMEEAAYQLEPVRKAEIRNLKSEISILGNEQKAGFCEQLPIDATSLPGSSGAPSGLPSAVFRADSHRLGFPQLPASSFQLPISLWFLTGKRFWYQTALCAWTFAKHSGREIILNLVDDSTLTAEHEAGLRRLFPDGVTVRKEEIRSRVEQLLPRNRFRELRARWDDYVNIRKLTDIHLGSSGIKLVLDSDMLFFRKPQAILDWWDAAHGDRSCQSSVGSSQSPALSPSSQLPAPSAFTPLLMTDCIESYGYPRDLMEELAGAPIPPLLNVGVCGLRSEDLNWEEMEAWCVRLHEGRISNYYLEQALVAMMAARRNPTVLPRADYITLPSHEQTLNSQGVLQHYVADSKPWYFGKAWKHHVKK